MTFCGKENSDGGEESAVISNALLPTMSWWFKGDLSRVLKLSPKDPLNGKLCLTSEELTRMKSPLLTELQKSSSYLGILRFGQLFRFWKV